VVADRNSIAPRLDYEEALRWPVLSEAEVSAAARIMTTSAKQQLSAQRALEEDFAAWIGARFALSFSNGTSALYAAMYALGLPRNSEVLTPSLTHWASVLPLCWNGLVPVFCDIDPETLCIDPREVERKISRETRAILVVHLFGQVANMEAIIDIARRRGLLIIEDASQGLGARHSDRCLGTLGAIGCFSLQSSKYLPVGEGGLLVTNDRALRDRALAVGHYDRLSGSNDNCLAALARTGLGFKFRIHPIAAELGRLSLPGLRARIERINAHTEELVAMLRSYRFFNVPGTIKDGYRIFWTRLHVRYLPFPGCPSRVHLISELGRAGVLVFDKATPYGQGLHREPIFHDAHLWPSPWFVDCPNMREHILERASSLHVTEGLEQSEIVTFPVFPNASNGFVRQYIDLLVSTLDRLAETGCTG